MAGMRETACELRVRGRCALSAHAHLVHVRLAHAFFVRLLRVLEPARDARVGEVGRERGFGHGRMDRAHGDAACAGRRRRPGARCARRAVVFTGIACAAVLSSGAGLCAGARSPSEPCFEAEREGAGRARAGAQSSSRCR
jgi:hypothetical protein